MKLAALLIAVVAVVSCSPSRDEVAANEPTQEVASNNADLWKGYPTSQPNGTPLTADYCSKVGDEVGNPFDNTKTCLMIACDKGDNASCELAATYNGNLWPDGEPGTGNTD